MCVVCVYQVTDYTEINNRIMCSSVMIFIIQSLQSHMFIMIRISVALNRNMQLFINDILIYYITDRCYIAFFFFFLVPRI